MLAIQYMLRQLAAAAAETLWPTRCVGCDLPGTLLCPECAAHVPYIDLDTACPRCAAPYGSVVCTECTPVRGDDEDVPSAGGAAAGAGGRLSCRDFLFSAARAATSYEGVAKRVVTAYKDADELRLDAVIATGICNAARGGGLHAVHEDWTAWADALVAVPANPVNLRKRGYDHLDRIAKLCAEWTGVPLDAALRSERAADQRALTSAERAANRSGSFVLANAHRAPPVRVLLVDDVLTTGATANAATRTLLDWGVREVRAVVYARVW